VEHSKVPLLEQGAAVAPGKVDGSDPELAVPEWLAVFAPGLERLVVFVPEIAVPAPAPYRLAPSDRDHDVPGKAALEVAAVSVRA
jgi:hypothetical protein